MELFTMICLASTTLLRVSRSGNVLAIETQNFTIRGLRRDADARAWAEAFESLRSRLVRTWLGDSPMANWLPKCEVVLHGSLAGYRVAVGTEAERTLGSTCVSFEGGTVVRRLVDIRANQRGWFDGAVPHELTHVLLAEYLDQAHFPAWADEGMAIQADPVVKRRGHHDDLQLALRRGTTFGIANLFVQPECPAGHAQTFCGQSASLVQFLARQGAPDQFVQFLRVAASDGYDAALQQFYGIAGTSDLERRWQADLPSAGGADAAARSSGRESSAARPANARTASEPIRKPRGEGQ